MKKNIGIIFAVILIALGIFLVAIGNNKVPEVAPAPPTPELPRVEPQAIALSESLVLEPACVDRNASLLCFEEYYKSLVGDKGIAYAFADLRKRYESNEFVRTQCHPLVHALGHGAVKAYPEVSIAFSHGDSFCWSGYYHGVMESILGTIGADKIVSEINGVCADIPGRETYSFDYYNCVHGLGHGVMVIHNNELFEALDTCAALVDSFDSNSCYGGVFMENVMVDSRNHFTKYLKPEDPLYPCNAVDSKYKSPCYLMQTSYMLNVRGGDFATVFALCRQADPGYVNTCFQSLGRDASGRTISGAEKTKALCDVGKDFNEKSNCIIGAVKDFISYHHSDVQAKGLCATLEGDLNKICLDTAVSYYRSF
ncbi:MAG: hypothetical protein AAB500_01905 [Patescibacteria group bacterium]